MGCLEESEVPVAEGSGELARRCFDAGDEGGREKLVRVK